MCRCHGGPPTIHAGSKAEDRYLNLEQLGKVLKTLCDALPGKFWILKINLDVIQVQ